MVARARLERGPADRASGGGNYFAAPKRGVAFVSSGCLRLDLALGGGWAENRVGNIVGDKSSGKCVRDAYIITEAGIQRIDDIGAVMRDGISPWRQQLALDSGRCATATHFYKETVAATQIIRAEFGLELEATPDHPVCTLTPTMGLEMRRAGDICPGEYLVVAPGTRKFGQSQEISQAWASLLGFFVADGTLSSGPLVISTRKQWARKKIDADRKAVGIKSGRHESQFWMRVDECGFVFGREVQRRVAAFMGTPLAGMTAAHKHVPPGVLAAPEVVQIEFLRALISCDSYITPTELVYTTASRRLAREVQMMLLNLGVIATFYQKDAQLEGWASPRPYWHLALSGTRFRDFMRVVGTLRPIKMSSRGADRGLYIPYIADSMRAAIMRAREVHGWSRNGKLRSGARAPRTGLFSAYKDFSGLTSSVAREYAEVLRGFVSSAESSAWDIILQSGYTFARVEDVERSVGLRDVYDVHVPEGHLFWSSGLISHNTLLAIEAAANFVAKYPKGRVRYREAESAFDPAYAEALGMPVSRVDFGEPIDTVEDLFEDLQKVVRGARHPELYIVDSLDALSDRAEMARDMDEGSYGVAKAKNLSQMFRRSIRGMASRRVTALIISQVRTKIGSTFGRGTTRSGGRALDFYASQVLYLTSGEVEYKAYRGEKRAVGLSVRGRVDKNKIALPYREAEFKILFGYGVDDVGASLSWLKKIRALEDVGLSSKMSDKDLDAVKYQYVSAAGSPPVSRAEIAEVVTRRWYEGEEKHLPTARKYG